MYVMKQTPFKRLGIWTCDAINENFIFKCVSNKNPRSVTRFVSEQERKSVEFTLKPVDVCSSNFLQLIGCENVIDIYLMNCKSKIPSGP